MRRAGKAEHPRGIYERVEGSGIWYARYRVKGKLYREIAGTKTQATKLYKLRVGDALQGKLPPALRNAKALRFEELSKDALTYSTEHKRSVRDDEERMKVLAKLFGDLPADKIGP